MTTETFDKLVNNVCQKIMGMMDQNAYIKMLKDTIDNENK